MLSQLQRRLARTFLGMPEAQHFALAGGAALIFHRIVPRVTQDLDFFGPIREEVRGAVEGFKQRLAEEGLSCETVRSSPSHVRLMVRDEAGEQVVVDIGYDFRLREPQQTELGPVLTAEELAADKLLALFGRAEARDFIDVYHLATRFDIGEVLRWAKQKDPGLDSYILATMIGQFDKLPRQTFLADDEQYGQMRHFYDELRQRLIDEVLFGSRVREQ